MLQTFDLVRVIHCNLYLCPLNTINDNKCAVQTHDFLYLSFLGFLQAFQSNNVQKLLRKKCVGGLFSAIFHGSFVNFVQDVGVFEVLFLKVGSLKFFSDASPPSPLSEPDAAAQSAVPVAVEHEGAEPDSHPDPH